MKISAKINKGDKSRKMGLKGNPGYYFHADEDFKEDWDWGKSKMIASKPISRPVNKFEI